MYCELYGLNKLNISGAAKIVTVNVITQRKFVENIVVIFELPFKSWTEIP